MNFEWLIGVEAVNLTSSLAIGGSDATEETPATVAVSTNRGATHTTSKNRNSVLEDQLIHDHWPLILDFLVYNYYSLGRQVEEKVL